MSKSPPRAGVIVREPRGILLGRVTHQGHWDIPKGQLDDGEAALHGAARELFEETGLSANQSLLAPLGEYTFGRGTLHLFLARTAYHLDTSKLRCSSMVTASPPFPELDAFCVVPYAGALSLVLPKLALVLEAAAQKYPSIR